MDALDSRYFVVSERKSQSKSYVVVPVDVVYEHLALVGGVAIV